MSRLLILFEALEGRRLFSQGFAPVQIETAYGFNQITFKGGSVIGNGAGQTIALIEVGNDQTLNTDLTNFDAAYGLSNPGGSWSLTVTGEQGGAPPPIFSVGTETLETALDLEWAHAIAPAANIMVVEADGLGDDDLNAAVNFAKSQPGVSVVSTSYVRTELSGDASNESVYSTPGNHAGVTFVAAAGDSGTATYPSTLANVVGVGGTTLTLGANNSYQSETVWNNSSGATGGGVSQVITEPAYQLGAQSTGQRTAVDVAYDGDPNTGFFIYANGSTLPSLVGGTSAGAPQWAALFAIADQGRALNGLTPLDGASQTLPMLYDLLGTPLYGQAFHDITSGDNGTDSAGVGYDYPTGLGSPQANVLVQYLAGNIAVPEPGTVALVLVAGPMLLKRPRRSGN
jgi:subtilase family serine protease